MAEPPVEVSPPPEQVSSSTLGKKLAILSAFSAVLIAFIVGMTLLNPEKDQTTLFVTVVTVVGGQALVILKWLDMETGVKILTVKTEELNAKVEKQTEALNGHLHEQKAATAILSKVEAELAGLKGEKQGTLDERARLEEAARLSSLQSTAAPLTPIATPPMPPMGTPANPVEMKLVGPDVLVTKDHKDKES